jgi:hypothetical protein
VKDHSLLLLRVVLVSCCSLSLSYRLSVLRKVNI